MPDFQPTPLYKMLQALFGARVRLNKNPLVTQIGVAATQILSSNPNRMGFVFVNLSAVSMYISPFNTVSATEGIWLAPNGGSVSLVWDRDMEACTSEWWALAGGAAAACYLLEYLNQ